MNIKVCGLTNREDVELCLSCGVDHLGFIFYKKSPRYISPREVRFLLEGLSRDDFQAVGVFVNAPSNEIVRVVQESTVDIVQLHGEESFQFCSQIPFPTIKVIRLKGAEDVGCWKTYPHLLLESYHPLVYGGSGQTVDWDIASQWRQIHEGQFFLSGGLNAQNVSFALKKVLPDGVDVSSGVELSPGVKDPVKVKTFVLKVKESV